MRRFNNPDSLEKKLSRYHVLASIDMLVGKPKIQALTLPSDNFIFEDMLSRRCGSSLSSICCPELNEEVYSQGMPRFPGMSKIKHIRGDVFSYLLYTTKRYNFVWLDLCNCLSEELMLNLESMVDSSALDDNCILSITIQKSREHFKIGSISPHEYRKEIFPRRLTLAAAKVDRQCKLLGIYYYRSTNRVSTPMSIYTFTINKNHHNANEEITSKCLDRRSDIPSEFRNDHKGYSQEDR